MMRNFRVKRVVPGPDGRRGAYRIPGQACGDALHQPGLYSSPDSIEVPAGEISPPWTDFGASARRFNVEIGGEAGLLRFIAYGRNADRDQPLAGDACLAFAALGMRRRCPGGGPHAILSILSQIGTNGHSRF